MAETLISEICKIRQENQTLCPKEYDKGVFRKELIRKSLCKDCL